MSNTHWVSKKIRELGYIWIQAKTYRDSVSLSSNSDGVALKKVTESPLWHRGLFRTLGRRLLRLLSSRSLPLIGVDDKDGFDDDAFRGRGIARHRGISQKAAPVLLCCLAIWWGNHLGWQHCLYCTQQRIALTIQKTKAKKKKQSITLPRRKPCGVTTLKVYDLHAWLGKQRNQRMLNENEQTNVGRHCLAIWPNPIWVDNIIFHTNITCHIRQKCTLPANMKCYCLAVGWLKHVGCHHFV